jgi:outer membrane protein assembly factor BamB
MLSRRLRLLTITRIVASLLGAASFAAHLSASDWPQFRGPNCSGRCPDRDHLPDKIGPSTNVLWKTPLPPGHSSPVVVGDRIYLTAVREKKLLTLALNRNDGRLLWEQKAPSGALETIHAIGSHAQSSPAADNERVISFFGSYGLSCYDRDGKLLWQRRMGPFKNDFGAGSSPVLAGDRVLLCQDHDQDSFLTALDKRSGETLWKTDRSDFLRGYCTPIVWDAAGKKQVVVAGTLRVAGYDLENGKEVWTVRGIARTICVTPVVGEDGRLYVAGWSAGGDPGAPIAVEPFDRVIKRLDKNGNGQLETGELAAGPIAERFTQVDLDKDGSITQVEYERFRGLFREGRNVVLAIRSGGRGDITSSHVLWKNARHVPFCASPLYLDGLLYTVKDGGFMATLDKHSGELVERDRLPGSGNYYSSPVAGDGKIYLVDQRGRLSVIQAGRAWHVLSSSDFEEDVYTTPALAGGRIYVRTTGHLYCFGLPEKKGR